MNIELEEKSVCTVSEETRGLLEQLLGQNRKIWLVCSTKENSELLLRMSDMLEGIMEKYSVVLLTDIQNPGKTSNRVCAVSTQKLEHIRKIYGMYEFSNRFVVQQPTEPVAGNLMNYVKNGLLTEEECIRVMLEE